MASESVTPSRKLGQLRVVDLKEELEKRGLEKTGVKAALTERLKKALEDEGQNPDEYVFESPAKKGKVDGEDEKMEEEKEDKLESSVDEQETKSDEKMENGEAVEETEPNEKKITADDVQNLEIEADGDLDDGGEDMDQFDADKMMAVDEVGGSDAEDGDNTLLGDDERKDEEIEDEEVITTVEEEKLLKQEEGKENVVPPVENTDKELECGTGDHQEDKTVKGEEGGSDCTPGRAAAADTSEVVESMPTTPMSVPPATKYQFTSEDTIKMDTSQDRKDDDLSLIVHVDESQNDLDSDLTGKGSEVGDTSAAAATKAAAVDSSSNVQLTSVADAAAPNADNEEAVPADKIAEKEATTDGGGPDAGAPKPAATASEEGGETTGEGQAEKDTAAASAAASTAASVDKINTSAASKEDKPKSIAPVKPAVTEKDKKASANSRSLWISGLANSTKAGDLKTLFTKYGKVTGAKIVTNTKDPGSKCYGFVTMSQAEEASKCIQHLHRTELHGKMISVERAKSDPAAKKLETKPALKKDAGSPKKEEQKKEDEEKEKNDEVKKEEDKKEEKKDEKKDRRDDRRGPYGDRRRGNFRGRYGRGRGGRYGGRSNYWHDQQDRRDRKDRDREGEKEGDTPSKEDKDKATPSKADSKEKDVLTLDKIKEAKESERLRQQERRMRQEERRRMRDLERERERQRDIERRQRDEHVRLQRERERLRMEKEKLEREKLEAERERIRLERERRERERQELMEQRRIEAQRFEEQQRARKRPYDGPRGSGGRDDYWDQPKRANYGGPQGGPNLDRDRRGYDDNRGNSYPERRVERYDRRDGRPIDSHRDEPARHDRGGGGRNDAAPARGSAGGGRRDSGPMPREPPTRERDERTRNAERYDRYDARRDQQRDDRGGHGNMRNERRQSPGRRNQQPPRNDRPQQRGGNDRYQDSGNRGRDLKLMLPAGNAPGSASNPSGWHSNRDNRQGQHNAGSGQSDGRWPASNTAQPSGGRPAMAVNSTPLLQAPPAANTFLASAANIMMGVGLANRGGQQDNRYDAYSRGMPGGQVRKY